MRRTFRGGAHPPEQKELTSSQPSVELGPPSRVVLLMRQHLGAPAKPIVKVGELVAEGQPVAEAGGFVSCPVHTSIAGKVTAVGKAMHPGGYECDAVTVEAPASPPADRPWPPEPWRLPGTIEKVADADPAALRALIQAAGIVGAGGAGFPTHVKLAPPKNKPIDTLIINAAECEPYLTCDHRTMLEEPETVAHGVRVLRRVLGVERVLFGIEDNKLDAARVMERAFEADRAVEVVLCRVKYPQGGEKQLIKALTGRAVPPPPGLPMDVGCVVQNVSTAAAVARAVRDGIPFVDRLVTLTGSMIAKPGNYRARLGSLIGDIVEAAGGLRSPAAKVIMGGPMMGLSVAELGLPIVKTTSGFVFLSQQEAPVLEPYPCIRCARCVSACPLGLVPNELALRVELGELDAADALHVRHCMECGTCSYVCPSHRWLVQQIRLGKAKLHDRKSGSTS